MYNVKQHAAICMLRLLANLLKRRPVDKDFAGLVAVVGRHSVIMIRRSEQGGGRFWDTCIVLIGICLTATEK